MPSVRVTSEFLLESRRVTDLLHLFDKHNIPEIHMLCGVCGDQVSRFTRGFLSEDPLQVVICEDHIQTEKELESVVSHELTHLLDYHSGNPMNTAEEVLESEFHASYYGDCYQEGPKISLPRRNCIINRARSNTRNVFPNEKLDYKSIYAECIAKLPEEYEVIRRTRGYASILRDPFDSPSLELVLND